MKVETALISYIILSALTPFVRCSLPDDINPVAWKMHVEFPVVDWALPLDTILKSDPTLGLSADPLLPGDTFVCSKSDTIYCALAQSLGATPDTVFKRMLGVCTVSNLPSVDMRLPLASGLPPKSHPGIPLGSRTTISLSEKGYNLEGIHSITFDETSPELIVTVSNQSLSAVLENTVIALLDSSDAAFAGHIAELQPGTSGQVSLPIAGKSLRSPIAVAVCTMLPPGTIIGLTDFLQIHFSFNGQRVSDAVIEDRYIDYAAGFTDNLLLIDSLMITKITTGATSLSCDIFSPAKIKLELIGSITNAGPYPEEQNMANNDASLSEDGAGRTFLRDTLYNNSATDYRTSTIILPAMNVHPAWNPQTLQSSIAFRFLFRILHDDHIIRYDKNDFFMIRIHPVHLPVVHVEGYFVNQVSRTTTTSVSTGLAAMSAASSIPLQSLEFTSARLHCSLCSGLSPDCSTDSLDLTVTLKNPYHPDDSVVLEKTLENLTCTSRYSTDIDVATLLNRWPDSLAITMGVTLQPGTFFSFANQESTTGTESPLFSFSPVVIWNAAVPLSFNVKECALFEPERIVIALSNEQLDLVNKLLHPVVRIILSIENRTDINCRLFVLAAMQRYTEELMTVPDTIIGTSQFTSRISENIVSLTSDNGITVMARNSLNCGELSFDDKDIVTFLSGEPCIIRIPIQLLPGQVEALRSGEYFRIRATGIIEGTGTSDTLASLY